MIEKLSCFGSEHKSNEEANINLAIELCKKEDKNGIKEIVGNLNNKNKDIANDCIKVLYEIGKRKPILISNYANEFLGLLNSRNNRMAWGSMIALSTITEFNIDLVFQNLDTVLTAYKNGSVIAIDSSITVFAKLCAGGKKYEDKIFPILIDHLKTCRIKEIPQHAGRMLVCINENNKSQFLDVLNSKKEFFTVPQLKRIEKIFDKID